MLGVEDISKSSDSSGFDCESLNRSLATTRELEFCKENKTLVQLIAAGSRKAIVQCQQQFSASRWNCTTFQGDDLFGKFINNG